MARKVKETPVLTGRDAERFSKAIERNKTKKVSASEYQRALCTYARIVAVSFDQTGP
jgi:hypothetical protein